MQKERLKIILQTCGGYYSRISGQIFHQYRDTRLPGDWQACSERSESISVNGVWEVMKQRSDDRSQKAEDRCQKTDDSKKSSENKRECNF